MTKVSVVIVNYNSGNILLECVKKVLASTIEVEVFVSDNGSIDDSIRLLNEYSTNSNLHIIENKKNLGFSKGNNIALPFIASEYILFLNPDCLIEPDTLSKMLEIISQQPDVAMAGCLICNADGTEQAGCRRYIPKPWSSLIQVFRLYKLFPTNPLFQDFNLASSPLPNEATEVEAISGSFMLVRLSAINHVGPFDPEYFLHCEDLDWCLRLTQAGYRILFVPNVVVIHIKGSCSINRPYFVEWHKHKGMLRFYRKFFLQQYPRPLLWLVTVGVWIRFGIIVTLRFIRRLFY